MKIIIPMAGNGQRFADAGYADPKPLIKLWDGRMIIEHALDMFQPEDQIVFLCNARHCAEYDLVQRLTALRPNSSVVAVEPHNRGPVYTVLQACSKIFSPLGDEQVLVSYCDLTIGKQNLTELVEMFASDADGCIFTHTGFHPHMQHATKMAAVRATGQRVLEVREKHSFTVDPKDGHGSTGLYYFRHARYVSHYFQRCVDESITYNGEYYVTLAYNPMIRDGLKVVYHDTPHVAILGTPEDVQSFNANCARAATLDPLTRYWADYLRCQK